MTDPDAPAVAPITTWTIARPAAGDLLAALSHQHGALALEYDLPRDAFVVFRLADMADVRAATVLAIRAALAAEPSHDGQPVRGCGCDHCRSERARLGREMNAFADAEALERKLHELDAGMVDAEEARRRASQILGLPAPDAEPGA